MPGQPLPLAAAIVVALVWLPAQATAVPDKLRLYDVSADVLPEGQRQLGMFWANYTRGVRPGVQLSTHLAGDVLGVLNLSAKVALLQKEELRVSVELGAVWPVSVELLMAALGTGQSFRALFFPAALRATTPLSDNLELNLSWRAEGSLMSMDGMEQGGFGLETEVALVRYDSSGAFMLLGRFPLLTRTTVKLDLFGTEQRGALVLDQMASWGVLLARDHLLGESMHVRLGIGYRHRPGIVLLQSLGHVLLEFDVYWR